MVLLESSHFVIERVNNDELIIFFFPEIKDNSDLYGLCVCTGR